MTIARLGPAALVLYLGASAINLSAVGEQVGFPADWNTFSADFTVKTEQIITDSAVRGSTTPAVSYRIERMEAPSGWKTITTFLSVDPFVYQDSGRQVKEELNPIARIEDDGDGSPPRIVGKDGRRLQLLSPQLQELARTRLRDLGLQPMPLAAVDDIGRTEVQLLKTGRQWVSAVIDTRTLADRRADLIRRYGAKRGQERGFDHYITLFNNRRTDVLAEPTTGLLSALDVYENNELVMHTTQTWVQGPGGAFVRNSTHSERAVNKSMRFVTDVTLSNVKLERRVR